MQNYKSMKNAVLKQHLKYDLNQALHVNNIVSFWIWRHVNQKVSRYVSKYLRNKIYNETSKAWRHQAITWTDFTNHQ